MKYGLITIVLPALLVSTGFAGEGAPSRGKLNKLGLGSMQAASDEQGTQVRGRFYFFYTFTNRATGGPVVTGTNSIGTPLTTSPPPALPIVVSNTQGPFTQTIGNTTRTGSSSFTLKITNTPPASPILPNTTILSPF